jgi:hypothetical protein
MKRYLHFLLVTVTAGVLLAACTKDEYRIYYENGTAPTLTATRANTIPMSFATSNEEAIRLDWTNPNYRFTTGSSSQNVTYQIQIDTVGGNFASRNRATISVTNELSRTFTQMALNDVLLNSMELRAGRQYNLEMRVVASLGSSSAIPLTSNVLRFATTPFVIPPKVEPYSTEVYVVGSATPGGWANPVPAPAQKMTQVSPTLYEITLNLTGGQSLLFLPVNGSWDRKYGFVGSNNTNNVEGDEFKREGGDIKVPAESGTYKIELNFQTGRFKFIKQ